MKESSLCLHVPTSNLLSDITDTNSSVPHIYYIRFIVTVNNLFKIDDYLLQEMPNYSLC